MVTNLSGNATTGGGPVLNASQKVFSYQKGAARTAQFTMNIDNPRADFILGNDCLLKAYRQQKITGNWILLMVGDIVQAEESNQGDFGLITVVAADPYWRLQRRLLGMSQDALGRGTGYTDGSAAALKDNSVLLGDIVSSLNGVFNTGVSLGTVTNCGTTGYLGPLYAQAAGDIIQQLCTTLGGPEFEIIPLEPSGLMPATIIGQMHVLAALGQNRPNCLFEYGMGKRNVATYDRVLSKDGLCNLAFSPPQGFPDVPAAGDGMVFAQDTPSESAIGLYQDLVQSDVTSQALRQELCNEYIAVRKQARQQLMFTPTVDGPEDFTADYNVGDTVVARAKVGNTLRYNGTVRVHGVDITVDENDAETITLTLLPS